MFGLSGSDRPNIKWSLSHNCNIVTMTHSSMTSSGGGWKNHSNQFWWPGFRYHFTALFLPFSSCSQMQWVIVTIVLIYKTSLSRLHHSVASSFATANGSATWKIKCQVSVSPLQHINIGSVTWVQKSLLCLTWLRQELYLFSPAIHNDNIFVWLVPPISRVLLNLWKNIQSKWKAEIKYSTGNF